MPVVAPGDERLRGSRLGLRLDRARCRAQNLIFDPLAFAVALLDLVGKRLRLTPIRREDQLQRELGMAEPAGGVDARRQAKAEIGRADARRIDAGRDHQRAQARAIAASEAAHASSHERAVLIDQRHDIGDRRQRDEIEQLLELERHVGRVAAMAARPERLRQLERDARAAQLGERIALGVRPAGSDDRRGGKLIGSPVVVGDHDRDAPLSCAIDGIDGRDAAVDRDDQPEALIREAFDGLGCEPVALDEAARQKRLDLGPEQAKREQRERGRADPIDVVVTVHDDAGAARDRALDQLACLGHRAEQEGVVERRLAVEVGERLRGIIEAATHERLGRDVLHVERADQPLDGVERARRDGDRGESHPSSLEGEPDVRE